MPVGDLDRDPGADAPALARARSCAASARVEVEPGVARRGRGSAAARVRSRVTRAPRRHAVEARSAGRASRRRSTARSLEAVQLSAAGTRAWTGRRRLASVALQVAGDLVQLVQRAALRVGDQQLDLGAASPRRPPRSARAARPAPRRSSAETSTASRVARAAASRALVVVQQVGLVEDEQPRLLAGADLLEHLVDRRASSASRRSSGAEASTTCTIRSASDRLLERRLERLDQLVGQLRG